MILTENLVEHLLDAPEIQALVTKGTIGSDPVKYPRGYIFEGKPYVPIDNLNRSSVVVVTSSGTWGSPLRGSRLRFPRIIIDIWAAPTKDADGNVAEFDADDVIEEVFDAMYPYIHLTHRTPTNGGLFRWESANIVDSEILSGPTNRNVSNAKHSRMGTVEVGVQK